MLPSSALNLLQKRSQMYGLKNIRDTMRKYMKWVMAVVIMLLFIGGMMIYPRVKNALQSSDSSRQGGLPMSGQQRQALNINAMIMNTQVLTDKIIATADIIADEEVDLSFETSGKITDIYFREGTHVQKGELLAKINDKPLQAQLLKLQAQLPLAQARVERQQTLLERDAVSKEAFETVDTELEKLYADIELVKANISLTELRAPFDGIIGLRTVSEGAFTSPSTVITKLTKISPIKVDFAVPERYTEDVTQGTEVIFKVQGFLKEFTAKVYAIESKIEINTRSLRARATYPNTDELLKPGRYASVEITKNEIKDALAVPSEAIIMEMGRYIVYVYKSGRSEPIEIIPGLRDESKVQVVQGLNIGDTVIVSGIMQLRTGLPVKIDNFIQ